MVAGIACTESVPPPGCLDEQHWFVVVLAQYVSQLKFDAGSARRAVPEREFAMAVEKLYEYVVARDPIGVSCYGDVRRTPSSRQREP